MSMIVSTRIPLSRRAKEKNDAAQSALTRIRPGAYSFFVNTNQHQPAGESRNVAGALCLTHSSLSSTHLASMKKGGDRVHLAFELPRLQLQPKKEVNSRDNSIT